MNTASVSTLLNSARRTGCVHEDRGADGHVATGTPGAATGVARGVAAGAGRAGTDVGAGLGPRRRDLDPHPGHGDRAVPCPGAPARCPVDLHPPGPAPPQLPA